MAYDPLAPFRRKQEPEATAELTEHQALGLAIQALGRLPDYEPSLQYELQEVYEKAEQRLKQPGTNVPMTDAEIDAAVEHDLKILEESRQDKEPEQGLKSEPVYTRMTDAEVEKAARAIQLLEEAARAHERQDIEPEM